MTTTFADLLRQLQEQHDLELAKLRLQLQGQLEGQHPPQPPSHACSTMTSGVVCADPHAVSHVSPVGSELVVLPLQVQDPNVEGGVHSPNYSQRSLDVPRIRQISEKGSEAESEEHEWAEVRSVRKTMVASQIPEELMIDARMRNGLRSLADSLEHLTVQLCLVSWSEYVHHMRVCRPFYLHPRWGPLRQTLGAASWSSGLKGNNRGSLQSMSGSLLPGQVLKAGPGQAAGIVRSCLLHPQSNARIAWDLFGACLLLYDLMFIPLANFGLPEYAFITGMEWVTLLFWTLDMLVSCRTGFLHLGEIVMDQGRILRNYFRTAFALDAIIVGPDWLFQVMAGLPSSGDSIGLFLRSMRILRAARILRLVKLARFLNRVKDSISSESTLVFLNVSKLILGILGFSHLLASLWYAIGKAMLDARQPNWIEEYGLLEESLIYRYLTSMHYTLTQFTPATIGVTPTNSPERAYGLLLLLVGLLVFSTFISSLTQNMSQLANRRQAQAQQLWLLRQYLKQHRVQSSLCFRVLRYLEYRIQENESRISESKLPILSLLSKPLQAQLRYAVSFTCLTSHPFVRKLNSTTDVMSGLVDKALTEQLLAVGDEALTISMLAVAMLCVESGCLRYSQLGKNVIDDPDCTTADPGDWICEAALWTEWFHLGTAVAANEVKVIMVDADSFARVVGAQSMASKMSCAYAKEFNALLSDTPRGRLSDIMKPYMVQRIYTTFESQIPDSSISGKLSGIGRLSGVVVPA